MYWCLQLKLAQNFIPFSELLNASNGLHIVESSSHDAFWGATPTTKNQFTGQNVLGRLLMRLRKQLLEDPDAMRSVETLEIPDFFLLGNTIPRIELQ